MKEAFSCIECGGQWFYRHPVTQEFDMAEVLSVAHGSVNAERKDISFPIYGLLRTQYGLIPVAQYENGEWCNIQEWSPHAIRNSTT